MFSGLDAGFYETVFRSSGMICKISSPGRTTAADGVTLQVLTMPPAAG